MRRPNTKTFVERQAKFFNQLRGSRIFDQTLLRYTILYRNESTFREHQVESYHNFYLPGSVIQTSRLSTYFFCVLRTDYE